MEEKYALSRKELVQKIKQANSAAAKEDQIVRYIEKKVAAGKELLRKASGYREVKKCKIIKLNQLDLRGINFSKISLMINPITMPRTYTSYNEDGSVSGSYNLTDRCTFKITLQKSDLREANFRGIKLCGADLSYTNLSYANFEGADLTDVNLTGANLFYAKLDQAILQGTLLSKANLSATNLCHVAHFNAHLAQKAYFFGTPVPGIELNQEDLKSYQKSVQRLISNIRVQSKDPIYQILQKILTSFNTNEGNGLIWLWALDPQELRLLYSYHTKRMDKVAKSFYQKYEDSTQRSLVAFATQFSLAIKYVNRQKILSYLDKKFEEQLWSFLKTKVSADLTNCIFAYIGEYSFFSSIPRGAPLFNEKEIKRWHQKFVKNTQENEPLLTPRSPRIW